MSTTWTRREAWWGLALNTVVFPGLGTVVVTGAWAGFVQTVASVIGLAALVTGDATAFGLGIGLLAGVAAWSIESSVRALQGAP